MNKDIFLYTSDEGTAVFILIICGDDGNLTISLTISFCSNHWRLKYAFVFFLILSVKLESTYLCRIKLIVQDLLTIWRVRRLSM